MEKIYMEEHRNKRKGFGVVNFSVVLSFAVALFAIISIATYGVVSNQGMDAVSYAAPSGTTTGDSFTFTLGKDGENHKIVIKGDGSAGTFQVPTYYVGNDSLKPVFCVEYNVNPPGDGSTVNKSDAITDFGLLTILNNSYANGVQRTVGDSTVTEGNRPYVEEWITQVAIWMYLYETQGTVTANGVDGEYDDQNQFHGDGTYTSNVKVNYMTEADINKIKNTVKLQVFFDGADGPVVYPQGENIYTKYVEPLVTMAKEASDKKLLAVLVDGDTVSKIDDGKYYRSGKVTVMGNPNDESFTGFDVTISGIEGATLIDLDGNALSPSGIGRGTEFYVIVPADKVTKEKQRLTIDAEGHFNTLTGNYFVQTADSLSKQRVVTVTGTTRDVIAGNYVDFVGVDDSGMNTAQTIYFIGLIVLLCGVGIVYANAKPVESKQQ